MNKKIILISVVLIIFCGFLTLKIVSKNASISKNFVGIDSKVDISPNDDKIIFSYYKNGIASIYSANIDGTDVTQLTEDSKKYSYLYPTYSKDGSKIMFIATPKSQQSTHSSIWIMDSNGKNKKEVLKADGFVNRAVFSPNQKSIYFSKAGVYKNYSPIARKTHHDFDIYSMDINGENLKQLTFDKSYNLDNLGITSTGNALIFSSFYSKEEENSENTYLFYLDGSKKIENIKPLRNSEYNDTYDPSLSPDDKFMVF